MRELANVSIETFPTAPPAMPTKPRYRKPLTARTIATWVATGVLATIYVCAMLNVFR